MGVRAALDLYCEMGKAGHIREPLFIHARRLRMVRYQRNYAGEMARTNTPEMKVRNSITMSLEPFSYFRR